ncbi:MAG: hypothetical protein D6680_03315 [Cyanobacteria bacterium J007]|nr:MAG: hypothetical protein D6680_03315 [Cyanobacteria bacterium J007]
MTGISSYSEASSLVGFSGVTREYSLIVGDRNDFQVSFNGLDGSVSAVLKNSTGNILRSLTLDDGNSVDTFNLYNLLPESYFLEITPLQESVRYTLNIDPLTGTSVETDYFVTEDSTVNTEIVYADKGDREIGIFSVQGMERLESDPLAYYQEAARRILSGSTLGQRLVSTLFDFPLTTETFSWESSLEQSSDAVRYRTAQSLTMEAGDLFGVMVLPKTTFEDFLENPKLTGNNRPVLSVGSMSANGFYLRREETSEGIILTLEGEGGQQDRDNNTNDIWIYIDKDRNEAIDEEAIADPERENNDSESVDRSPLTDLEESTRENNIPPKDLDLKIEGSESVQKRTLVGSVRDRNGFEDLDRIDLSLQTAGQNWTKIASVTEFEANDSDTTAASFSYEWDEELPPGTYRVKARAYDRAGKTSRVVIESFTVTEDTSEPVPVEPVPVEPVPVEPVPVEPVPVEPVPVEPVPVEPVPVEPVPVEPVPVEPVPVEPILIEPPETPILPPSLPNTRPEDVQFRNLPLYTTEEILSFSGGKVYDADGADDIDRIDFWLRRAGSDWIDIPDVTEFIQDRQGKTRFSFSYDLSELTPGRYELKAIAYDRAGEASDPDIQNFILITDPESDELSDEVRLAIAQSANLDNYTPEELTDTREWLVWVSPGESSETLAELAGASDLGAAGHIPNTFIWEFPDNIVPDLNQLNAIEGVELAYPLVPIEMELLSEPYDEPLVRKPSSFNPAYPGVDPNDPELHQFLNSYQWHLRSGVNPGTDANITEAWNLARGKGVVIGIVDDALDYTHPEFASKYRPDLSWDFNENDSDPSPTYNDFIEAKYLPGALRDWGTSYFGVDVPLTGVVKDMNVHLDIAHPEVGQLWGFLSNPNEAILDPLERWWYTRNRRISGGNGDEDGLVTLFNQLGGTSDNFTDTIFDDEAPLSITDGLAPFTGSFKPQQMLDNFDNQWAGGVWNLGITDFVYGNSGSVNRLGLELETYNPHGTPVAGIAAAHGTNGIGGSGVAPEAELAALRLIADEIREDRIADALSYFNQDIDIYNNSWKTVDWLFKSPQSLSAIAEGAMLGRDGLGSIYVFAAGNDALKEGNVNYNGFANSRYAIAVAGIDHLGRKTFYSEPGAKILVSAYSSGSNVGMSTADMESAEGYDAGNYTNRFGGTSAAAPIVSGAIALMLEVNPNLTWRDVQHILVETAQKNDPTDLWWQTNGAGYHINEKYGFGAIDVNAAVHLAANWTPVGAEEVVSSDLQNAIEEITDGQTVTSEITIDRDIAVENVEIVFDADCENWSDLTVILTSPDGTQSILAQSISDNPNLSHIDRLTPETEDPWVFTSVRHWGESSKGTWTLTVMDEAGNQVEGSWNSWKLNLYGTKPTLTVRATEPTVSEDGTFAQVTLNRTGNLDNPLTAYYTVNGTAISNEDYQEIVERSIQFAPGESSRTINISPIDDAIADEGNESVILTLESDDSYSIGAKNSATVLIKDNDIAESFTDINAALTGVADGAVDWGDYDKDGNLDILLIGSNGSERITQIYRNDNGDFNAINPGITGSFASGQWGDYDNDGNLDLLLTGWDAPSKIYQNNGSGSFTEVASLSSGGENSAGAWGDTDRDGDLDLVITTSSGGSQIFENNEGTFIEITSLDLGGAGTSVAWGDYDNDGDLDLLAAAQSDAVGLIKVYRNDGSGNFTDINAPLTGAITDSVDWGDYDNDGDLDILSSAGTVYQNDSGSFIDINAAIQGVNSGSVNWGDYDNDGDLDILLVGGDRAQVYENDSGIFTDINAPLIGVNNAGDRSAAWGDYDNDGDLDILAIGSINNNAIDRVAKIYRNNTTTSNTVPTTATDLNALVDRNSVTLSWNPATDAQTPETGLTYNLRVGTTPGGSEIVSPLSLRDGDRQVVEMGNVNHNRSWTLENLEPGSYFWSVQAIDTARSGSVFANQGTFTVTEPKPELEWVRQQGTAVNDMARDVAVDSAGNVYTVGYTGDVTPLDGSNQNWNTYFSKYDATGNLLWKKQLTEGAGNNNGYGIAVDSNNHVYLVGRQGFDAYISKYDSEGSEIWQEIFSSFNGYYADLSDAVTSIAIDERGNLYITGATVGRFDLEVSRQESRTIVNLHQNVFTAKYDSEGNRAWIREIGGIANEFAGGVAVDNEGNSYVAGMTQGSIFGEGRFGNGSNDGFLVKYDKDGNTIWQKQFGTLSAENVQGVNIDSAGNAYVVGETLGAFEGNTNVGDWDAFVAKYDNNGNPLEVQQFGTATADRARKVEIDDKGNIYIIGETEGDLDGQTRSGVIDTFVTRLEPNGVRSWTHQIGNTGIITKPTNLTLDRNNNILYGVGTTGIGALEGQPYAGGRDEFLLKYKLT